MIVNFVASVPDTRKMDMIVIGSDKIGYLKEKLAKHWFLEPACLQFEYRMETLEDYKTIDDYEIGGGSTIRVNVRRLSSAISEMRKNSNVSNVSAS